MNDRGHGAGLLLTAVTALLGAGCGERGVLYPAVGLYGALPPAAYVESSYSRGQYEGVGFQASLDLGARVLSRFEVGGGLRLYAAMGYKGICPSGPHYSECSGRPYSSNALSILSADLLVVRARLLPWHAEQGKGPPLSLIATVRAGLAMPWGPDDLPGLYVSGDWDDTVSPIFHWTLGLGVGGRYPLSGHVALALDADVSWLFLPPDRYGTLTIFTLRAGPVLRF